MKTVFNTEITDLTQIGVICNWLRDNWFVKMVVVAFRLEGKRAKVLQVDSNKKVDRVSKYLIENLGKGNLKVRVEAK